MRRRNTALVAGVLVLGGVTVAPADERVTLTAHQLDLVTAGYGFVMEAQSPGTPGWTKFYYLPPDTFQDRASAERSATAGGDYAIARGEISAYKYQITGH